MSSIVRAYWLRDLVSSRLEMSRLNISPRQRCGAAPGPWSAETHLQVDRRLELQEGRSWLPVVDVANTAIVEHADGNLVGIVRGADLSLRVGVEIADAAGTNHQAHSWRKREVDLRPLLPHGPQAHAFLLPPLFHRLPLLRIADAPLELAQTLLRTLPFRVLDEGRLEVFDLDVVV